MRELYSISLTLPIISAHLQLGNHTFTGEYDSRPKDESDSQMGRKSCELPARKNLHAVPTEYG